ncbi:VOC family protein [Jannaschia formosa]|uniref:VOC family protein n=1 Tax=Jannaschia formosa TaxID=2259592 RepID=UPI000E1C0F25|nr:VOC family protein [Jannaschia formosa]TFL18547.1 VOC family protein [Jannaschia formosa]
MTAPATILRNAPDNAIVWAEIPVRDLDAACAFYGAALSCDLSQQQMGPNMAAVFPASETGVSGHLYEGKPAGDGSGPTVSLCVPDTLEATMDRVRAAGGKVVSPAIQIPAGRFFYATDPDGNSLSFFQN